jgi:4-nitrophenyl phosphatase
MLSRQQLKRELGILDGNAFSSGPITDAVQARLALETARAVLLDLDGTLVREDEPIDGAHDLLLAHGERALILSNNSSDTERTISGRLRRIGFDIPPQRFLLAGTETVRLAAERWPGARVMLIASAAIRAAAEEAGLVPVSSDPEVVLLARTTAFNYATLALAANAVRDGAFFLVANPDMTHPGANGAIVPETGALAAAIAAASDREPDLVIGKPQPSFFRAALGRLGVSPQKAVMVGDNPDTDGAGARRLGMPHIIVGPDLPLRALVASPEAAPATCWPRAGYALSK